MVAGQHPFLTSSVHTFSKQVSFPINTQNFATQKFVSRGNSLNTHTNYKHIIQYFMVTSQPTQWAEQLQILVKTKLKLQIIFVLHYEKDRECFLRAYIFSLLCRDRGPLPACPERHDGDKYVTNLSDGQSSVTMTWNMGQQLWRWLTQWNMGSTHTQNDDFGGVFNGKVSFGCYIIDVQFNQYAFFGFISELVKFIRLEIIVFTIFF